MFLPSASFAARPDWVLVDSGQPVSEIVQRLFRAHEIQPEYDRRRDKRIAFPRLLTLRPLEELELRALGGEVTVVGKSLASNGLDFYHCDTLPYKRAVVSFGDFGCAEEIHLVLNISWCRFLRPGWYDSGGRFTHIVKLNNAESHDDLVISDQS